MEFVKNLLDSVWGKEVIEDNKKKPDPITTDMVDLDGYETLAPSAGIYSDNEQTMFSDINREYLEIKAEELGIPLENTDEWIDNWFKYSQDIRKIESENDPTKTPETTTAKGVYQFTDESVESGKVRLSNQGYSSRQDWSPYSQDFIDNIPKNPQEWTDEQSDAMFLSNMFSQKGSDYYMRGLGTGDTALGNEAYYKFHHKESGGTGEETINRVEDIRPVSEEDKLLTDYNETSVKPFTG